MKRWFVARMVEDGPGNIVPKVSMYPNVNMRVWSKDGFAFGLGQLATANLTPLQADPDIRLIPDASLDNLLSTIPTQTRQEMITGLTNAGFNVTAVKNTWTFRQLLQHLKLQLQADDNIESGDVRDIEG
jgi:hypothetical protein